MFDCSSARPVEVAAHLFGSWLSAVSPRAKGPMTNNCMYSLSNHCTHVLREALLFEESCRVKHPFLTNPMFKAIEKLRVCVKCCHGGQPLVRSGVRAGLAGAEQQQRQCKMVPAILEVWRALVQHLALPLFWLSLRTVRAPTGACWAT